MVNAIEYINMTVGKPWVNRGEGPNEFDCWGLVMDSFRKIDGVELPQINGYTNQYCKTHTAANEAFSTGKYIKCQPQDGAIMAAFTGDNLVHVGRCLAGGVLHATTNLSVRFDKYRVIKATQQRVEYYKYAPDKSSQITCGPN